MLTGPVLRDVVLVGCGHAHVAVLRRFGMRPVPGVRLTLVTPELDVPYSGMLPGVVEGHYRADEAAIDAGPLARFAGARLYATRATGLDPQRRLLRCAGRPDVPYDLLSLDIGAAPALAAVPGAAEHAVPVKPIAGLVPRLEAVLARLHAGEGARLAVVGGGAGGVELAFALERRLARAAGGPGLLLVTGRGGLLPGLPARLRARVRALLAERGVAVEAGPVVAVEAGWLVLADGTRTRADEALWTTAAGPAPWLRETGLALDDAGFLAVDAALRVGGRGDVFAAGDTAAFGPRAIARSGVHAVRAGPVLAHNLRAALMGEALRPYRPQRHALVLLSTGDRQAIGTRNGVVVRGGWVWRWKDRLDRRFVARFTELPAMAVPGLRRPVLVGAEVGAAGPRCGGCGAKVGAGVLARALSGLRPLRRPEVVLGLDAPDDAALVDLGDGRLSVHSVDQFRAMVDDPWRFGQIAANHALGDLYAMGAEPRTALAIAGLPPGPDAKVEADLAAMMGGAGLVLSAAGCALVGGHTAEAAELTLGFAVNGVVDADRVLRKAGLRPGDALVLTKALGTGTLMVAAMQGRARGRWVEAALVAMVQPAATAARLLREHGAHAATDVTGFGLLGHLDEMARAGGVACVLDLAAIPLLDGAAWTAGQGLLSSLAAQNAQVLARVAGANDALAARLAPLLCDPQTAGGLLAGLPAGRAAPCVQALQAAGYLAAAVIGRVEAGGGIRLVS